MKKIILLFFVIAFSCSVFGQVKNDSELYKTILNLDKQFFEAYNTCEHNLDKYASFYATDLEFYHDKGGLMTSKKDVVEATKKNICEKVTRELIIDSVEVHEIPNYGAIQIGYHKFNNLVEKSTSKPSKFIVFWKKIDGDYKIAKVVSLH